MKKETYLNKAVKLYNSITPIQNEIREKCETYIHKVLEENGGSIDFDDYDVKEYVSVPYDGGNHPEYASNCFSMVNGVFINKTGHICLNTDDCSEYYLEDVDWSHVFAVAEYLRDEILK